MAERDLKEAGIRQQIRRLLGQEALHWEDAFEALCLRFADDEIELIARELTAGGAQGIYWLIRYLVRIERPLGFEKLRALASGPDDFVRAEALSGIAQVSADPRLELVLRLLASGRKDCLLFAARQLGRLRRPRAVLPLIAALDESSDEEVQVALLEALAKHPDARPFRALERWATQGTGKAREEALAGLTRFADRWNQRLLKRCFASASERVREMAALAALRLGGRQAERWTAAAFEKERSPEVLMSALPAVREIRTQALFSAVLRLALHGPTPGVRMLAGSVIRKSPSLQTARRLLRAERGAAFPDRRRLIRFLFAFPEAPGVFRRLRGFARSPEEGTRLLGLEGLGRMRHPKRVPILMEAVEAGDRLSWVAALALTESMFPPRWDLIGRMLGMAGRYGGGVIQTALKYLLRLKEDQEIPESVRDQVLRLTESGPPGQRILVAEVLPRLGDRAGWERLFALAVGDPHAGVRRAAFEGLLGLVERQPDGLAALLHLADRQGRGWGVAARLFRRVPCDPSAFEPLVGALLDRAAALRKEVGIGRPARRVLLLLRHQIELQRARAFAALERMSLEDSQRQLFLWTLNRSELPGLEGLRTAFLAEQFETASGPTRLEYLEFFKRHRLADLRVERAVFRVLQIERDERVTAKIGEWVRNAAFTPAEPLPA